MTVKELIDVLRSRDPDAIVCVQHLDMGGYYDEYSEVTEVSWENPKEIILYGKNHYIEDKK